MENVFEKRMEICKKCPLMKMTEYGPQCDNTKWISPDGTQVSLFKKLGGVRGCGCYLNSKTKNLNNHCIIKKG